MAVIDIQTPGTQLQSVIQAAGAVPNNKVYLWALKTQPALPAIVIGMPEFDRISADQGETPLGFTSWLITFPVFIIQEANKMDAQKAQNKLIDMVEKVADAINDNPTLNGTAFTSTVEGGGPQVIQGDARQAIQYTLEVDVTVETLND